MLDVSCELEDMIYDIMIFCEYQDCSPEKVGQNEEAQIFQITGILNTIAAITYERVQLEEHLEEYTHEMKQKNFDMFQELGKALGKFIRFTIGFDPKLKFWNIYLK